MDIVLTMSVKSSSTVFRLLRHLATETRPVSGGELAHALGVPVTNAVRALATLQAAGYAERHHGSAGFVIGKSARTLAFAFMAQFPVRDLTMPYLQQLTLETGLTSSLFIRLGWYAVRIGQIIGPSVLIHPTRLGEAYPLTEGAPSLAMLAHLPEGTFEQVQARTGAAPETVAQARTKIRADCVAVAPSLAEPDMFDMAAPLLDRREQAIAAIAVEGMTLDALPPILAEKGAARRVMHDLAVKISEESTMHLSHYDHIDNDLISFGGRQFRTAQ
jgi:DNA-binding IclR family transcriptional regulator